MATRASSDSGGRAAIRTRPAWLAPIIGIPLVALTLFATVRVPQKTDEWRERWHERLDLLASDRQRSIERALTETRADVLVVAGYPTAAVLVAPSASRSRPYPADTTPAEHTAELLERAEREHGYRGFWIVDREARVLATSAPEQVFEPVCAESALAGLDGVKFGVHAHGDGSVVMSVSAPIRPHGGEPAGTVLMEAPGDRLLLEPLRIVMMPGSSLNAQLVARFGDEILFLTAPGAGPEGPLGVRQPLGDAPLATAALLGDEGFHDGVDYRGARVLGIARKIQPIGWGLVVKIDRREARRELRRELLIEGLALGFALAVVMVITWSAARRERDVLREAARREMHESEKALRTVLDSTYDAIVLHGVDGAILDVNATFERLYGGTRADAVGRTVADISSPSSPLETLPSLWESTKTGKRHVFEWKARRLDDATEFDVEVFLRPVRMRGREMLLANVRDITERKRTEAALRQGEAEQRAVFDALDTAVVVLDAKTRRILRANRAFLALFGLDEDARLGPLEDWLAEWDSFHPDGRAMPLADEPASRAVRGEEVRGVEMISRNRVTGQEHAALWSAAWVRDPSGDRVNLVMSALNITERRRAENAQRESEARFRDLANNISQLAWMADPNGSIRWYNQRWFDYTGTTPEQMRISGWRDLLHPDHRDRVEANITRSFASGAVWEDTFPLRGADGAYRWFLSRAVPIRDEGGQIIRWFGTNTDVTERLELERDLERRVAERTTELETARRRLQLLNRRVVEVQEEERKAVADELHDEAGQSLTALLLSLAMLEKSVAGDQERVEQIRELKAMIDQVMQDLHGLAVKLRPISLDRLGIEAALRQLAKTVASHDLQVDFEATGLDGRRLGNEVETTVYRVVQEALENTRRHSGASRAEVLITREDRCLTVVVEDNGRGFEPAATDVDERSGLFALRERLELVGGRLDIDSRPGSGATVRVEIPLVSVER